MDDNGSAKMKQFGGAVKETAEKTGSLMKIMEALEGVMEPLIAIFAVEKVFEFSKGLVEAGGEALKFGEKIGLTVDQVTGLTYAAKQSEVSSEDLQTSLTKFSKNVSQAADGTGKAATTFKQMGVAITDAHGHLLPTEEILKKVADRFTKLPDGADKARLAMEMFGKSGAAMVPLLNKGGDAIAALEEKGAALSGITQESAEAMKIFSLAVDSSEDALKGVTASIISSFSPALKTVGEQLQKISDNIAENLKADREHAEQEASAEKMAVIRMTREAEYYSLLQRNGKVLTSTQQASLRYDAEQISALNERLGLSKDQIDLTTLEAKLLAQESGVRSGINAGDTATLRSQIELLKSKIGLEEQPKKSFEHDPDSKEGAQRLKAAEEMAKALALQSLDGNAKIEAEYKGHLEKLEGLDSAHYGKLKVIVDNWRKAQQQALVGTEEKAVFDEIDKEQDARAKKGLELLAQQTKAEEKEKEQHIKIMAEKFALSDELYLSDEDRALRAIDDKANAMRKAAFSEVDVAKWSAKQRSDIEKKFADDAKKQADEIAKKDQQVYLDRYQAAATFFSGTSQLMTAMAGKNRTMLLLAQKLNEAEVIMNTAVGITKAFAQGGVLGFVTGAGIAAAGAAQLVTIEKEHFESGGVIGGGQREIVVNERGQEGVLNHRGLRNIGADTLNAINAGASRQQVAKMLTHNTSNSQTIHVNIAGVVDQRFVQDTLMPALNKHMRKR